MNWTDSVRTLKGVGTVRAQQLDRLGIQTVGDLVRYYPRDYEDRSHMCTIRELMPDVPACFTAMVSAPPRTDWLRKGLERTRVEVADHTGRLVLLFFNQTHLARQLQWGQEYVFYGACSADYGHNQMTNPVVEDPALPGRQTRCIVPLYSLTAGLSGKMLSAAIGQALDGGAAQAPETLPEPVRQRYGLCGVTEALEQIHRPTSAENLAAARRRLCFEELFTFCAGLSLLRAGRSRVQKQPFARTDLTAFFAALPFALTGAQRRVIDQICADLTSGAPMCRLVQGDVGSGKTMVAAAALVCAAQNGAQSALLAPTEILAQQHARTLMPLLEGLGVRCALLTGSMKESEKKQVRAQLAEGQIDVAIGTHALLSDTTVFSRLELVITDEQHRFGVAQRAALAQKGSQPHLLLLSATPIPRTLSMILYGDLDVSVIDELPPGRQKVDTFLVGESMRPRINAFIRKQVAAGHQCFIVCPAIEESETESLKSAELWAQTLQKTVFPDLQVALLHGKMNRQQKEEVMAAFAAGQSQILVATTVIEVGVDVPNANLMVIENADRFGLSQLHQLRGRVGRGREKSYCVLFSNNKNADTRARLEALCRTNDGFAIARSDLELRGPGDLFGQRQHGLPAFRCAGLGMDLTLMQQAQQAAAEAISDPATASAPEFAPLVERVRALFENGAELFP